ncbi:hypothetical protein DKP78_19090, partial [Enterococcus faecium]
MAASLHADEGEQRGRQLLERPRPERQRDVGHAHEDDDQREGADGADRQRDHGLPEAAEPNEGGQEQQRG